jgi:hypothetical protein
MVKYAVRVLVKVPNDFGGFTQVLQARAPSHFTSSHLTLNSWYSAVKQPRSLQTNQMHK